MVRYTSLPGTGGVYESWRTVLPLASTSRTHRPGVPRKSSSYVRSTPVLERAVAPRARVPRDRGRQPVEQIVAGRRIGDGGELRAIDGDDDGDAVVDEHDATAVEDPPARRLDQYLTLAVGGRLCLELL